MLTCYTVAAFEACTYMNTNNLVPIGGACKYWYNAQGGINYGSKLSLDLPRSKNRKTLTIDCSLQGRFWPHWNYSLLHLNMDLMTRVRARLEAKWMSLSDIMKWDTRMISSPHVYSNFRSCVVRSKCDNAAITPCFSTLIAIHWLAISFVHRKMIDLISSLRLHTSISDVFIAFGACHLVWPWRRHTSY